MGCEPSVMKQCSRSPFAAQTTILTSRQIHVFTSARVGDLVQSFRDVVVSSDRRRLWIFLPVSSGCHIGWSWTSKRLSPPSVVISVLGRCGAAPLAVLFAAFGCKDGIEKIQNGKRSQEGSRRILALRAVPQVQFDEVVGCVILHGASAVRPFCTTSSGPHTLFPRAIDAFTVAAVVGLLFAIAPAGPLARELPMIHLVPALSSREAPPSISAYCAANVGRSRLCCWPVILGRLRLRIGVLVALCLLVRG